MLISVIIATYNRQADLERVLKGLLDQKLSGSFGYEIIVVDNNSTDMTQGMVNHLIPLANGNLKYLKQPVKGKCHALNMGISSAKGEIIAFTDDDVITDPDWLSALVKNFDELQCDAIAGRVLPIYPKETPQWVKDHPHQMAGTVVIYDQGDKIRLADHTVPPFIGSNWAFKRSIFTDCGLFRIDLGPGTPVIGEDEEFYFRLLSKNKKLYYCPQVIIYHPVDLKRLSLKNTIPWHIALGRFAAQQEQENKHFVYWFGIPRYLYRGITIDFIRLCISVFYYPALFNACRSFFSKAGMVLEHRRLKRVENNIKDGKIA